MVGGVTAPGVLVEPDCRAGRHEVNAGGRRRWDAYAEKQHLRDAAEHHVACTVDQSGCKARSYEGHDGGEGDLTKSNIAEISCVALQQGSATTLHGQTRGVRIVRWAKDQPSIAAWDLHLITAVCIGKIARPGEQLQPNCPPGTPCAV